MKCYLKFSHYNGLGIALYIATDKKCIDNIGEAISLDDNYLTDKKVFIYEFVQNTNLLDRALPLLDKPNINDAQRVVDLALSYYKMWGSKLDCLDTFEESCWFAAVELKL